jgi:hypothetical protein
MGGVGAPKDTIFGIIGATKMSSESKSLGGLVESSSGGRMPQHMSNMSVSKNTDQKLIGTTKTALPGSHYGQIPYAGQYYGEQGSKL